MTVPFEFDARTRIVFGPGRLREIGELVESVGDENSASARVMLVTDTGVVSAGHVARATEYLQAKRVETVVFSGVHENPTTEDVARGLTVARDFHPSVLIGLGGGSSMDCAKGVNFLFCCGGRMQDYWGQNKATGPLLPMIAVPTTAGTGSEVQSFAIISDAVTHAKMACGDVQASPRVALLDPELTLTQPRSVTAATGIDAVTHAVESYVSTARNALSETFALSAWRHLSAGLSAVLAQPHDLDARSHMQIGACMAGLSIENSMLGAAHALANPLTARYDLTHGKAVGLMLPHVVRFNGPASAAAYAQLAALSNGAANQLQGHTAGEDDPAARFAAHLSTLLQNAGVPQRLQDCGVNFDTLDELAAHAATQWTAKFNPREVSQRDLLKLYEAAY